MAITIVSQPNLGYPYRAYQPLVYLVNITSVSNPPTCKAQLYVNGVAYGAAQTATHIDYDGGLGAFKFKFDATALLRDYTDNEETWGSLDAQTATVAPLPKEANTGYYKRMLFYFEFTEYIITPPDGTSEIGGSVTSNVRQAINAKADTSSVSIYDYAGFFPSLFLTNAPRVGTKSIKEIGLTQSDFLTYYSQGTNGRFLEMAEVTTYDDSGALIATYYINVDTAVADANRLRRVGFGPTNLNNTPALQFSTPPTFPIITDSVYFYEVRIVYVRKIGFVVLGDLTHYCRYYLTDTCEQLRVFYNNEFGSDDGLNFSLETTAETYENQQTGYSVPIVDIIPTVSDRGSQILNSSATRGFVLRGKFDPDEKPRIKELLNSPNLAVVSPDRPTEYIKVVNVKTGNNVIKNSTEDGSVFIDVELTLEQSAKDFSHQN